MSTLDKQIGYENKETRHTKDWSRHIANSGLSPVK